MDAGSKIKAPSVVRASPPMLKYIHGPRRHVYVIDLSELREKAPKNFIVAALKESGFGDSFDCPLFVSVPEWYVEAVANYAQRLASYWISFRGADDQEIEGVLKKMQWVEDGDVKLRPGTSLYELMMNFRDKQNIPRLVFPQSVANGGSTKTESAIERIAQFYKKYCMAGALENLENLKSGGTVATKIQFIVKSLGAAEFLKIEPELLRMDKSVSVFVDHGAFGFEVQWLDCSRTELELVLAISLATITDRKK